MKKKKYEYPVFSLELINEVDILKLSGGPVIIEDDREDIFDV